MPLNDNDREQFWDDFCADYLGKKSLSCQSTYTEEPVDEAALFQTSVDCCRMANEYDLEIRFYLEGKKQTNINSVRHLLPQASDLTFDGYHQRMSKDYKEYCLIINDPERLGYKLWDWSRRFLRPLFDRSGMNNIGIYYALFIGNYSKTSFGVHFDPESVFHVPVVGSKKMRLWEPDYVHEHDELINNMKYEDHLEASTTVEAQPGGMVYWPKRKWHISESSGHFHVSLALSMTEYADVSSYFANRFLVDLYELKGHADDRLERIGNPFNSYDLQQTGENVPETLVNAFEKIRRMMSVEKMKEVWLQQVTAYGFTAVPYPLPIEQIDNDDFLQGDSEFPAIWQRIDMDKITLSVNGHLAKFPFSPAIIQLLETLNSGEIYQVSELLEPVNESEVALIEKVLQRLLSFRFVSRCEQEIEL